MKFSNKIVADNSDEEVEEEEEGEEYEDEQSQESEDDNKEADEEEEEEDEGDEVEDDEDFVEGDENVAPNAINDQGAAAIPRQSLGGGNKKIVIPKPSTKKPKTQELVVEAIQQLNEKGGSSAQAIAKYIINKYPDSDGKRLKFSIKRYIKSCLTDGTMVQIKMSFKLTNKHESKKKILEKEKLKAKKEKEKEKEKLKKEKEKNKEKKTEKSKEKGKEKEKKATKPTDKSKDKTKTTKRTKADPADDAKAVPAKKTKLDKGGKSATDKTETKNEKSKTKKKLGRKSINLVVRPTPPRPKTMKKTKSTAVVGKKKIDYPEADSNPALTAVKATGKGKRK